MAINSLFTNQYQLLSINKPLLNSVKSALFMSMTQDRAETVALQALAWLVSHDDLLPVFLGASGASEADLRSRAGDAEFLGSVLDFLTMDDAWVIAFCDTHSLSYETPMMARAALPGGAQVHWT